VKKLQVCKIVFVSRSLHFLIWNMGGTQGAPARERGVACPQSSGQSMDFTPTVHRQGVQARFLIWNMGGTPGAPTRERGVACPEVCGLFTDRPCTVHTNQ
jgi:hypothetical protein